MFRSSLCFSGLIVDYPGNSFLHLSWLRFTQFVNLIGGSNLITGDELESCTSVVQPGKPFDLDGRPVVLIDTPGFDDTVRSDVDVLNMIAAFLETS